MALNTNLVSLNNIFTYFHPKLLCSSCAITAKVKAGIFNIKTDY
jgi:hypothetical protein